LAAAEQAWQAAAAAPAPAPGLPELRSALAAYRELRQRLLVELPLLRDQLAGMHQQDGQRDGQRQRRSQLQVGRSLVPLASGRRSWSCQRCPWPSGHFLPPPHAHAPALLPALQASPPPPPGRSTHPPTPPTPSTNLPSSWQARYGITNANVSSSTSGPQAAAQFYRAKDYQKQRQQQELQQELHEGQGQGRQQGQAAAAGAGAGAGDAPPLGMSPASAAALADQLQGLPGAQLPPLGTSLAQDVAAAMRGASGSQQPQAAEGQGAPGELLKANTATGGRIKSAALAALEYRKSKRGGQAGEQQAGGQQAPTAAPQVAGGEIVIERAKFDVYARPKRNFFHTEPTDPDSGAMLVAP
jgi:hypothetical protein